MTLVVVSSKSNVFVVCKCDLVPKGKSSLYSTYFVLNNFVEHHCILMNYLMWFYPLMQAELLSFVFGFGVWDSKRWGGCCECWVATDTAQRGMGTYSSTRLLNLSTLLLPCLAMESTLPTLVPLTGEVGLTCVVIHNRLHALSWCRLQ